MTETEYCSECGSTTANWQKTGTPYCSGANKVSDTIDKNECSPTYNQSGTPETTCSGSWGAWDYNCKTNTKSRTSSCGCSESASRSSSEVSSQ